MQHPIPSPFDRPPHSFLTDLHTVRTVSIKRSNEMVSVCQILQVLRKLFPVPTNILGFEKDKYYGDWTTNPVHHHPMRSHKWKLEVETSGTVEEWRRTKVTESTGSVTLPKRSSSQCSDGPNPGHHKEVKYQPVLSLTLENKERIENGERITERSLVPDHG